MPPVDYSEAYAELLSASVPGAAAAAAQRTNRQRAEEIQRRVALLHDTSLMQGGAVSDQRPMVTSERVQAGQGPAGGATEGGTPDAGREARQPVERQDAFTECTPVADDTGHQATALSASQEAAAAAQASPYSQASPKVSPYEQFAPVAQPQAAAVQLAPPVPHVHLHPEKPGTEVEAREEKLPGRPAVSVSVTKVAPTTPTAEAAPLPRVGRETAARDAVAEEAREDWLSLLVEHLWPYIHDVTEKIAWETVPATLDQTRPSFIHSLSMLKFSLGTEEPDLRNIRCFSDKDQVTEDVFLEMDLEWRSKQDVEIELQVLGKDVSSLIPNFLEAQLAKLFTLIIGIEDFVVKGTLQIALRPLMRRVPIVGALQVAFTEVPHFNFKPTIEGGPLAGALGAMLPSIKSWLDTTVRDAVFMPYVLPEHYFYPLDPEAPDLQRPVGVLHCRIMEACNVPRMDIFAGSDTFVECYVRHTQRDTTEIRTGKHPIWKELFCMPLHDVQHQVLNFALWDHDPVSPNDEIGRCQIPIASLEEGKVHDLWLDVASSSEEEETAAKKGEGGMTPSRKDRALRALAAPAAGHSTKKTRLHVRVHWRTWNEEEGAFIRQAVAQGVDRALREPPGQALDPALRNLLAGGMLKATVKRCSGLKVWGLLKRPSVMATVRVGKSEPKASAAFKISRRGVADLSAEPLQLSVGGEEVLQPDTEVVVELFEVGFLSGGNSVGRLRLSLRQVTDKGSFKAERALEGVDSGKAEVELTWTGTFS